MVGDEKKGSPRKTKRWLVGVACALLLAVLAAGIFLWAPWETEQDGSDATQDSTSEMQDVSDEQEQSESSNGDTQTEDEEWLGQSLGYVGPNGEGALDSSDYESDEDYLEALAKLGGGIENDVDTKSVVDPDGQSYEQGVLLIYFYRTCSEYDAHQLIEERGGVWQRDSYIYGTGRDTAFVSAYFSDCLDYESLIAKRDEIASLSEVSSASLNYAQTLDSDEASVESNSVPTFVQTYLSYSQFPTAWETSKCEKTVSIAVIDTSFVSRHQDLVGNVLFCWDVTTDTLLTDDEEGESSHGTMVAGIASAVSGNKIGIEGCSYNAWLMLIDAWDEDGNGYIEYSVAALELLAEFSNPPDVVNMSFGSYSYCDDFQDVISCMRENFDTVFVASAGNNTSSEDHYPSGYDGVISVGSVGIDSSLSSFSNTNASVDLCALGEDILSTANPYCEDTLLLSYSSDSGTSFSAPQVAAAAALIKAKYPDATADEIEQALELSARDLGTSGRDDEYGWGALDAAAALELMDEWRDSGDTSPNTGGSIYDAWDSLLGRVGLFALPEERLVGIAA